MRIDIAVFARAPIAGRSKTRLIAHLGAEGAAALQHSLIGRTVRTALSADLGSVSLWCAPNCDHPAFVDLSEELGVALYAQAGVDLGARMRHAFSRHCRECDCLLVGTDCPALTATELRAAGLALVKGNDAVFIPAEDGGYVLIGLRRPIDSLFDNVPWGSDRVMEHTRESLRRAGLRWHELNPSWDVDRPEDVDRLHASGLMRLPKGPE